MNQLRIERLGGIQVSVNTRPVDEAAWRPQANPTTTGLRSSGIERARCLA
jgi:hypothetical protein